ncbi:MAG: HD domain-containing phosphohydrolase [Puniceicoccales bacterium]
MYSQQKALPRILIVDDSTETLEMICEILEEKGYEAIGIQRAEEAIAAAEKLQPDLILLDSVMPDPDGYRCCELLREIESLNHVPIIFVSGVDEPFEKVKAFQAGAVDYLTKPFHPQEIDIRITTHLRLSQIQGKALAEAKSLSLLIEQKIEEISESQMAMIFAMAKLSESRDLETGKHMERIQNFCQILSFALRDDPEYGRQIDEDFLKNIVVTSPLHDIGKVGIEDAILLKPGKLTPEEFDIMKRHSVIGAETLQTVYKKYPSNHFLSMAIEIARSHHERWDGSGYPDGLAGKAIPLSARIMGLADVYDALRSLRPYKPPFSHEKALRIIQEESGTHFDPRIVQAFLKHQEEFSATWHRLSRETINST